MDKPRAARPTIKFIDEYCASYKNLFPEVRSFEAFKHLHVGMIPPIKFKIELVLADSLYGESENKFLGCLEELKLDFVVAITRNYGVWMSKGQRVPT